MDVVNLTKGATVSLTKGQVVNLTKEIPGLDAVTIGLGWDPVDKEVETSGLFGLFKKKTVVQGEDIDCDAFALALQNGKVTKDNVLYFSQKRILGDALIHTGDNLTGDGDGDDEQIIVNLKKVPSNIDRIVFAVNIYQGRSRNQSFGKIKNAFIRIVDARDNKEMCIYNLSNTAEFANVVTVHFGDLIKGPNGWEFEAVGKPSNAGSIPEFEKDYL